jgi:hypothetical protein
VAEDLSSSELAWAQGLLDHAQAVLTRADAGEVDLSLDDLIKLRETERDLTDLVTTLSKQLPVSVERPA